MQKGGCTIKGEQETLETLNRVASTVNPIKLSELEARKKIKSSINLKKKPCPNSLTVFDQNMGFC